MSKLLTVLFLALALVGSAGTAQAAPCSTRQLAGTWVGHATDDVDLYCIVEFRQDGVIQRSNCFAPRTLKPTASLVGSLSVDENCDVAGNLNLTILDTGSASPATFDGKINPDQQQMSGDFFALGQLDDYRFVRLFD